MGMSLSASVTELGNRSDSQFRLLNNNIRAYGGTIQGALVRQRASNRQVMLALHDEADDERLQPLVEASPATLCHNPRSLMQLWAEFKFGINGRKPAESFTIAERNVKSVKQKYWRRNLIWKAIGRLVRGGMSAERAMARIREVYGERTGVTKIMQLMIRDKTRYPAKVHPRLL